MNKLVNKLAQKKNYLAFLIKSKWSLTVCLNFLTDIRKIRFFIILCLHLLTKFGHIEQKNLMLPVLGVGMDSNRFAVL